MKEAHSCVAAVGCTACSQFLFAEFERPSKVSVAPKNAVPMDHWLVEGDWMGESDVVLQNTNYISTGSSPMSQETGRPRFHAFLAIVPLHGEKVLFYGVWNNGTA
jgi:hypothetical protein